MRGQGVHVERTFELQTCVALENVHQGLRGAGGLRFTQGNGLVEHLRREGARGATIGARDGVQSLKAVLAIRLEVAAQRGDADAGAGGAGNPVALGGGLA